MNENTGPGAGAGGGFRREEDRAHEEWLIRERRLTLRAMLLTLAVVIAPFLVLPFGLEPALVVLAVGMLLTAVLCWSAARQVGPLLRSRLNVMAILNGSMALVVIAIVIARLNA